MLKKLTKLFNKNPKKHRVSATEGLYIVCGGDSIENGPKIIFFKLL